LSSVNPEMIREFFQMSMVWTRVSQPLSRMIGFEQGKIVPAKGYLLDKPFPSHTAILEGFLASSNNQTPGRSLSFCLICPAANKSIRSFV
jgi:hypothetical protein